MKRYIVILMIIFCLGSYIEGGSDPLPEVTPFNLENADSLTLLYSLPSSDIVDIEFSPDGNWLAFAGDAIWLFPIGNAQEEIIQIDTTGIAEIIDFNSNSEILYFNDGTAAYQWDFASREAESIWFASNPSDFSEDGNYFAHSGQTGYGGIARSIPYETGSVMYINDEQAMTAIVISEFADIVVANYEDSRIAIYGLRNRGDANLEQEIEVEFLDDSILTVLTRGKQISTVRLNESDEVEIVIWNTPTGEIQQIIPIDRPVTDLAYTSDASMVAAVGSNEILSLWNVETGKNIANLEGTEPSQLVVIHPDNQYIATVSESQVAIWGIPAE